MKCRGMGFGIHQAASAAELTQGGKPPWMECLESYVGA